MDIQNSKPGTSSVLDIIDAEVGILCPGNGHVLIHINATTNTPKVV